MVMRRGVPVRGFTLPKDAGSNQSRDIANSTREAPMSRVMTTVVRPATAPAEISVAYAGLPTDSNAVARAASAEILSNGIIPVMTRATAQ